MKERKRFCLRLLVTLTIACGLVTLAGAQNAYINGTFAVAAQDSNGDAFQESLYFDGAGNFSGTGTGNANGVISTYADSGTYTVQANGQITVFDANGAITTGSVSADGNTFVGNYLTAGQVPTILVAVKQNQISQLNTGAGLGSLFANTTGIQNNASGYLSLYSNTTGSRNNASGAYALFSNTAGTDNNAMGYQALYLNTVGYRNSAVGAFALAANTTGTYNNAVGYGAMAYTTTGSYNNAQGYLALESNTTGNNNIALGQYAGYYLTGNSNIDIGNEGVAGESGAIRIGSAATATYIAGISTSTVTGAAVYVTSSGQLGVLASSERYKTAITPIGTSTEKLQQLRPVSFHLKTDPKGVVQYGLIAEEVASVYPELVIRDAAGNIQGVRYDELAPMLLNAVQQQSAEIRDLKKLVVEMQAGLRKLQAKDELLAQR